MVRRKSKVGVGFSLDKKQYATFEEIVDDLGLDRNVVINDYIKSFNDTKGVSYVLKSNMAEIKKLEAHNMILAEQLNTQVNDVKDGIRDIILISMTRFITTSMISKFPDTIRKQIGSETNRISDKFKIHYTKVLLAYSNIAPEIITDESDLELFQDMIADMLPQEEKSSIAHESNDTQVLI